MYGASILDMIKLLNNMVCILLSLQTHSIWICSTPEAVNLRTKGILPCNAMTSTCNAALGLGWQWTYILVWECKLSLISLKSSTYAKWNVLSLVTCHSNTYFWPGQNFNCLSNWLILSVRPRRIFRDFHKMSWNGCIGSCQMRTSGIANDGNFSLSVSFIFQFITGANWFEIVCKLCKLLQYSYTCHSSEQFTHLRVIPNSAVEASTQWQKGWWLETLQNYNYHLGPLLLTWFNFNPNMDK